MIRSISRTVRTVPRLARGYAEAAPAEKLVLSFALPRTTLFFDKEVSQVNLPTTAGDIGVLANHVPTLEELNPGVVEVVHGDKTDRYFTAGGFATVSDDSTMDINGIEAFPLEDFDLNETKDLIGQAQKNASSADKDTALEAQIELEVLEALADNLK